MRYRTPQLKKPESAAYYGATGTKAFEGVFTTRRNCFCDSSAVDAVLSGFLSSTIRSRQRIFPWEVDLFEGVH